MRLVTWNLNGNDDVHLDERTEAAVFTMVLGARLDQIQAGATPASPPDVIVLQEVTARMFAANISTHLAAGSYKVIPPTAPQREIFEVVAWRDSLQFVDYQLVPLVHSNFGRILHAVDFRTPTGDSLQVLTAHFDSGVDASKVRVAQLRQVAELVGTHSIFAGDANLRRAEWDTVQPTVDMRDAWQVVGQPPETRVTWERDEYKARFDRVFVGRSIQPVRMHAYGRGPLPGIGVPISDHVGLVFDFAVNASSADDTNTVV